MKTFFKSLKRQDGFTLVELMVVVAIIGLLSSVAIPNFKKYQAKSKISEAKLQLSSLYTAETAFFSDYNIYGACLRYMGFDPAPERLNRYYGIGFSAGVVARDATANTTAVNSGLQDGATDCPNATAAAIDTATFPNNTTWFPAGKGIGNSLTDTIAKSIANAAGAAAATCTETGIGTTTGNGTCIGTQSGGIAGASTMVFQASAVGFISGNAITDALASGLTINHNKIIKTVVNGY
jgi:type IV pilus assembly protein PilA